VRVQSSLYLLEKKTNDKGKKFKCVYYAPYNPVAFLRLLCKNNNLCNVRLYFKQKFSSLSLKHALEFSPLQPRGGPHNSSLIRHRGAQNLLLQTPKTQEDCYKINRCRYLQTVSNAKGTVEWQVTRMCKNH